MTEAADSPPAAVKPAFNLAAGPALLALAAAACLSAPVDAQAQARTAVTVERVHLRSGPGRQYPSVRVLPAGLEVQVQGCLSGFTWCDVIADADRGWVHGQRLQFDVDGRTLRAPEAGTLLGLTILGFALGHYWSDHYTDRPWYGQRYRWLPPAPPPPPPPMPPPLPPPVKPPTPKLPPPLRWLPPAAQPPAPHPPRPPQGPPPGPPKSHPPEKTEKPDKPAKPGTAPPREPVMSPRAVN